MSAKIIRIAQPLRKGRERPTLKAVLAELAAIKIAVERLEKAAAPLAWWERHNEQT